MTTRALAQEPEPTAPRDEPQPAPAREEPTPREQTGSVALRIVAGLAEMGRVVDGGAPCTTVEGRE
jgi:hypothetical protein